MLGQAHGVVLQLSALVHVTCMPRVRAPRAPGVGLRYKFYSGSESLIAQPLFGGFTFYWCSWQH